jgi:hypothetical protein
MAKEGVGKTMIENQTDNQYELQLSAILVALLLNTLFFLFIFCLYQQERSAAPFISPSFDAHEDIMITIQPDAPTPPEPALSPPVPKEEEPWVQTTARQSHFAENPQEFMQAQESIADVDQQKSVHHNLDDAITENDSPAQATQADEIINEPDVNQAAALAAMETIATSVPKIEEKITPAKPKKSAVRKVVQQKTLPSVAAMAQGFLEQIKENGTSAITMLSKNQGVPSQMQLQHERYLEKLFWHLQKTFRNNENKIPRITNNRTMNIHFALDKNGMLKQINVMGTSDNNIQFDNAIVLLFKEASQGFPPVPRALPHEPYEMTVRIEFGNYAHMR